MATSTVNLTEQEREAAAITKLNEEAAAFANDPWINQFKKDAAFMEAVANKTEELKLFPNKESWKAVTAILFSEGKVSLKDPAELVRLRDEKAKQDLEAAQLKVELAARQSEEAKVKLDKERRATYEARDRAAGSLSQNRTDKASEAKKVFNQVKKAGQDVNSGRQKMEQARKDAEPVYFPDGHQYAGTINHAATEEKRRRIAARGSANAPHIPTVAEIKDNGGALDIALLKSLPLDLAKQYKRNHSQYEAEVARETVNASAQQKIEKFGK